MLTTAQPNGRLYCTLHTFFFSPAPILPADTQMKKTETNHTVVLIVTQFKLLSNFYFGTPTYSDDVNHNVDVFS